MSGKRLLDAIQLLNVSKTVAAKHFAIRQHQLDVYTRTSSLTKGIKAQTEGLILTAQAAAALARRFDETSPPTDSANSYTSPSADPATSASTSANAVNPNVASVTSTSPPDQAHTLKHQAELHIPAQTAQYVGDEKPAVLNVSQQQDVFYQPSTSSAPDSSSWPKVKLPEVAKDEQVVGDGLNADVFPSPVSAESQVKKVEGAEELSEEMLQGLFHSPRVSRMMSGKPAPRKEWNGPVEAKPVHRKSEMQEMEELAASVAEDVVPSAETVKSPTYQMLESRVPSSRLGRLWQYGGLATSMAFGAVGEGFRRATGSQDSGSIMFSAGNMERMVAKLSKMRGAALKLGQMLSIQDSNMLPEPIQQVLQRVQDRADYMPAWQRDKVLTDNLGPNWRDLFTTFNEVPMAAASIGQVHSAVLASTGEPVAVKVQYPGVADSIDSDLNNLSILLTASRLLPKGLYLDKTIANARTELAWECDYIREAEGAAKFRALLASDSVFVVPKIIPAASGKQVLTMEMLNGVAVTKIQDFTQSQRDWIGTQIMRLCLREIAEFHYMQTDPNWTNFLYNASTNKLELLDFGASRAYPEKFISTYVRTLVAASRNDTKTCHDLSIQLGYLTGMESPAMVDAHISSMTTLAEPFMLSSPDLYDFSNQTITDRVRALIPIMIRERLAPPPEETYSLHRKLSGAFLLCARLGSAVPCKQLFIDAIAAAESKGLKV
ncbi:uncharacterized protein N7511_007839 [Penicillium nucicola]|uniref:uncharacterized protein n=1 Tax=Penicillium nucicola TaxID=1850975 RepID=UPI002545231D|nr:uncharacterized protein N7511_007839 [Penicillium nucicola]KAJ5753686.1 hypothetical protein N7511_007839 [Penicillium nucicola]